MGYTTPVSALIQFEVQNIAMNDSTTYYLSIVSYSTNANLSRIYVPRKGVIRSCEIFYNHTTQDCTAENTTVGIKVNDTTLGTIYTGSLANANSPLEIDNLNLPVDKGDYIHLTIDTPAWVTNPTGTYLQGLIEIAYS